MDDRTKRFLNSIHFPYLDSTDLEMTSIQKSPYDKDLYICNFHKDHFWNYKEYSAFINGLEYLNFKYELYFSYGDLNDEDVIELVKEFCFNDLQIEHNFDLSLTNDTLNFLIYDKAVLDKIEKNSGDLQGFLQFLRLPYGINVVSRVEETTHEQEEYIDEDEVLKERESEHQEYLEVSEKELQENLKAMNEERKFYAQLTNGELIYTHIGDINTTIGKVDVNGEIFNLQSKKIRNGATTIFDIGLRDETGAIYVTFFANDKNLPLEKLNTLKVKSNIRVKGHAGVNYKSEIIIKGTSFDLLPDTPIRGDDYQGTKRVELHLHTNMSELDAVSDIQDYLKLAKNMGHKAIAITDHADVQAFPKAQNLSKKFGVKILYGCEVYLSDDKMIGCINPTNQKFKDATFVCFDLESTGLLVRKDKITEFGAVKIQNGFIVDRLDILINPECEIPEFIAKMTGITNEMVKNAPTIKEALPRILKFIDGCVLISHNAKFDNGLLNEEMMRNGFGELINPTIDSLALSRYYFAENMLHSLGALCRTMDVTYSKSDAHRADYDAEVLAQCFMGFIKKITDEFGDPTLKDIEYLPIKLELLKKRTFHPYHATILAKNQDGLKSLYKIVSESHVDTLGSVPIVRRSTIEKYRKNLLIGSACFNGEVFQNSAYYGLKTLQNSIIFYDFIEIQPLSCYSYLINMREIPNEEILKDFLRDIINEAKKENKLIVATGDVHYANPSDKKYRDVYIAHKVKNGSFHPLNPRSRDSLPYFENPDQHYLSTQEMLDAFAWLGNEKDIKEFVIDNTNKIADMITEAVPIPPGTFAPKIYNCENMLHDLVYTTAHELYGEELPAVIKERLDFEMNVIVKNGYSVIYYISHKLVKQANDDGYLVGSRGSVGSSLVATMAGVTEVNPLAPHYRCPKCKHVEFVDDKRVQSGYDLPNKVCPHCGTTMIGDGQNIPFQTFLGFHGEKTPDIDLNFPTDYQATAHNYTKVLLGEKNVYRAGTISAVQERTAYGYVREYYEDFLHKDPNKIKSADIASLASGCVEVKRTTGQHPGGIVVIPNDHEVYDFTPVQYPANDNTAGWLTTHFPYESMHETILKLDMLGHVDPQAIKMMVDLTGFDYKKIPFNDPKVLSIFYTDEALGLAHIHMEPDNGALGIPEFGTKLVRQMLRETKPKNFGDLIILSGLSHGTNVWQNNARDLIMDNIVDLYGVIGCRDDVMTYLISRGLNEADAFEIMETVRKKDKKLSDKQKELMLSAGIPQYYIESCDKIEYLFPRGHACAYVMMAVRVAYYKVYYPLEYYATFFSLRCDKYDIEVMTKGIHAIYNALHDYDVRRSRKEEISNKEEEIEETLRLALEMAERGYTFANIDIERSDATKFKIDREKKQLIPPFKVVDGLGDTVAQSIIDARNEKPFISKDDFSKRSKISSTNVKVLEKLGALDKLSDTNQISLFDFM